VNVKSNRYKILAAILAFSSFSAYAASREQVQKLYSSLTGGTANKAEVTELKVLLDTNKTQEAARSIINSNKGFYNVTLKNFYTPMSNEDGSTLEKLNDMTATLIGVTRDEMNFFDIFYKNLLYRFKGEFRTNSYYIRKYDKNVPVLLRTNNEHFAAAGAHNLPMGDPAIFGPTVQNGFTTLNSNAIAGIFSTRGWSKAYYEDGTNRASFKFFARNFLCLEMEELNDTSAPDTRVRRDVDRTPGGESKTFKNSCVGCHAGQDALGGAFAYYDFSSTGDMRYAQHDGTDDPVVPKINANNIFPDGKIVESDYWENLWAEGQNAYIGWGAKRQGWGVKELGKMFSETKQVRSCLSKKVFEHVCYQSGNTAINKEIIASLASKFNADGNMKNLFINAAIACMGE
jgi:hypothetical protein